MKSGIPKKVGGALRPWLPRSPDSGVAQNCRAAHLRHCLHLCLGHALLAGTRTHFGGTSIKLVDPTKVLPAKLGWELKTMVHRVSLLEMDPSAHYVAGKVL